MMRGISGTRSVYSAWARRWIRDDDFFFAQRGRVPGVRRIDIGTEKFANARQVGQELERQEVGGAGQRLVLQLGRRIVFEALMDLGFEAGRHALHQRGGLSADGGRVDQLFAEETRE
jgi:hypothetical protein